MALNENEQGNVMQQRNHALKQIEDEILLAEIFKFFANNWKFIVGLSLAGGVASGCYLTVASSKYEATALIEMAQVPSGNNMVQTTSVEAPTLLIERLKNPSTYTPNAIKACAVEGAANPSEAMPKLVEMMLPRNLSTIVQISVRRGSPDLAKQCIGAVVEMVRDQQKALVKPYHDDLKTTLAELQSRLRENQDYVLKAERAGLFQTVYLARRDESSHLKQQINEVQRLLSRNSQTRLVSPIYASPNKVSPKQTLVLGLGIIAGMMLGLLFAIGSTALKK